MEDDETEPVEGMKVAEDSVMQQGESSEGKIEDLSNIVPAKRKVEQDQEDQVANDEKVEESTSQIYERKDEIEKEEDTGDDTAQYASVVAHTTQPTISAAPPPKKKAKGKAGVKGAKASIKDAVSDRGSTTGTPEVELPMESKKGGKKKASAALSSKGKKRKASTQISASSTPAPDREETPQDQGEQQIEIEEDGEDKNKLYCICETLYDNEKMMVECDRCDDWYHTACMGMEEEKVKFVDFFICPHCEPLTTYRTSWRRKCARIECENAVVPPITRYCCDECGILVAMSKLGKVKQFKGMALTSIVEKLASPQVINASKIEGIVEWNEGQIRKDWLRRILQKEKTNIPFANVSFLEESIQEKVFDLPEMEMLSRLEARQAEVQKLKINVNSILDSIAARIKLLQLAEDRVPLLEPLFDEDDNGTMNGKKSSSSNKVKRSKADETPSGQPRCGYDDRLSWDEARFQAWCHTQKAKDILDQKINLDGTLVIDEMVSADETAICGRSSRKCKRHGEWMLIRGAEMEADQICQTDLLSSLDNEGKDLTLRIEQVQIIMKDILINEEEKRKERDAALARQLANEGTRRAITSM